MQGSLLNKCCVGKVLRIEKHPNADRLSVCDVQTDNGVKKVVCGGTNLRTGMRVAFAHTGATVRWHGTDMVTLEKTKIRGVESEGMICAAEELDLASRFPSKPEDGERAIIDMGDSDEGVGVSLAEYLRLGDTVLHIDNHAITHRADLFSHYGFAREFVALGLGKWKKTKVESGKLKVESKKKTSTFNSQLSTFNFPKKDLPFQCLVDDKTLVPRYTACLLEIDNIGETPDWMKKKLEATGWRSINLPIDITNYVATELGMPLHSFDADDIQGDMHIRGAKQGEKIVTLDTVDRVLPEGAIVMNDDIGIFDLFGITRMPTSRTQT
jgi:phenylalanyl-tRNA synthetase beta chain